MDLKIFKQFSYQSSDLIIYIHGNSLIFINISEEGLKYIKIKMEFWIFMLGMLLV